MKLPGGRLFDIEEIYYSIAGFNIGKPALFERSTGRLLCVFEEGPGNHQFAQELAKAWNERRQTKSNDNS